MRHVMKFNPYAALLITGGLMVMTVVIAQIGSNLELLKAGAVSVDRDVSSLAAKALTSVEDGARQAAASTPEPRHTRVALLDGRERPSERGRADVAREAPIRNGERKAPSL